MATVRSTEPVRVQTEEGWVVVLQQAPWSDEYELWIGFVNKATGKFSIATVKEGGYLELKEFKEGEIKIPPTMRINGRVWDGLAEALRRGISQIDKKVVDVELSATQYHLEDMRKLVFEDKNIFTFDPNNVSCAHGSCLPGQCNYKKEILKQKIEDILG